MKWHVIELFLLSEDKYVSLGFCAKTSSLHSMRVDNVDGLVTLFYDDSDDTWNTTLHDE